jgi:hypothetical protein
LPFDFEKKKKKKKKQKKKRIGWFVFENDPMVFLPVRQVVAPLHR